MNSPIGVWRRERAIGGSAMGGASNSSLKRPGLSQGLWEYGLGFESLNLTVESIENALGFEAGASPLAIAQGIEDALKSAPADSEIRAGYRILPGPSLAVQKNGFRLAGVSFHTGPRVADALKGATGMAIFVATLGERFDQWVSDCLKLDNPFLGYAADVVGAEAVERLALWIEARIAQTAAHAAMTTTYPHSPGFDEWNLHDQEKLFSLLPPRFCGVRLSNSSVMQPLKSVSGVIGIGTGIVRQDFSRPISCGRPRRSVTVRENLDGA